MGTSTKAALVKRKLRSSSTRKSKTLLQSHVSGKNDGVKKSTDPFYIKYYSGCIGMPVATGAMIASLALTLTILVGIVVFGVFVRKLKRQFLFSGQSLAPGTMSATGLSYIWDYMTKDGPFVAFVNAPVFPGALSSMFYFVACVPGALLHIFQPDFAKPYKIQRTSSERKVPGNLVRHQVCDTLLHSLRNNFIFAVPGMVYQVIMRGPWMYYSHEHWGNHKQTNATEGSGEEALSQFLISNRICLLHCDGNVLFPNSAPSNCEFMVDLTVCLLVFDLSYHYWHRFHHLSRPLYRYIHRIHHEYHAPFVWVTQYEHFLELMAVALFSMAIPICVGCHPLTEWVWLVLAVQLSVEAHTGYDFGFLDKIVCFKGRSIWGGTVHHDRHHELPMCNFQPFFTWFDYYYETDYNSVSQRRKRRVEKTETKQ
jgi:sterol desaturase/sphingolipid hydroxylase (fatty acid hydroxylase superfamily)